MKVMMTRLVKASKKLSQLMAVWYGNAVCQLFMISHATGDEMIPATAISTINSITISLTKLPTLAPSTLRMLISFFR